MANVARLDRFWPEMAGLGHFPAKRVGARLRSPYNRIVAWINYPYRVVYIRFIGTHKQYDAIDAQTI